MDIWITKEGKRIPVDQLTGPHLNNIIAMLENNKTYIEKWLDILRKERRSRFVSQFIVWAKDVHEQGTTDEDYEGQGHHPIDIDEVIQRDEISLWTKQTWDGTADWEAKYYEWPQEF